MTFLCWYLELDCSIVMFDWFHLYCNTDDSGDCNYICWCAEFSIVDLLIFDAKLLLYYCIIVKALSQTPRDAGLSPAWHSSFLLC